MKLYTEKQLKRAMLHSYLRGVERPADYFPIEESILKQVTPIELPSDVEVGKIVLGNSPIMEHRDSGYFAAGAMKYNKWLKEQILNQNES